MNNQDELFKNLFIFFKSFKKDIKNIGHGVRDWYIEYYDETLFEKWIQIYYCADREIFKNFICVEEYFEDEIAQDEYGNIKKYEINEDGSNLTDIKTEIINDLKGKGIIKESYMQRKKMRKLIREEAQIDQSLKSHPLVRTLYAYDTYYYSIKNIGGQDSVGRSNEQYVKEDVDNIKYLNYNDVVPASADNDADEELYKEATGNAPDAIIVTYSMGGNEVFVTEDKANEYLYSLENYPLLGDESNHSEKQYQEQLKELSGWTWREIKRNLLPNRWEFVDPIEDTLDSIEVEDIYSILFDADIYFEEKSSGDGYYLMDRGANYADLRSKFYGFLKDNDMIPDGTEDVFQAWVNDEEPPLEESISIKKNFIHARKYYENEWADDEYGEVKKFEVNEDGSNLMEIKSEIMNYLGENGILNESRMQNIQLRKFIQNEIKKNLLDKHDRKVI